MTGAPLAARYPFLPGAAQLLGDEAPSFQDLVSLDVWEPARRLGRDRVLRALRGPGAAPAPERLEGFDDASDEVRVLAFLYERMLVAVAPSSPSVTRRWCEGESQTVGARLRQAPVEELLELAGALDLPVRRDPERLEKVVLDLPSYVRLASGLREERFRLGGQEVQRGEVTVEVRPGGGGAPHASATELLQEGVRFLLAEELAPLSLDAELRDLLCREERELLERVSALAPAFAPGGFGALRPEAFPPCMREMRALLDRGQNVPHAGRFALASFLHKVGVDLEGIVDAYRGAPNFKEGITRYQTLQITRHDGGAGYTPPDCATLALHGLCFREKDDLQPSLCADPAKLRNPLNYYRLRSRARPARPPAATPAPTAGPTPDPAEGAPPRSSAPAPPP